MSVIDDNETLKVLIDCLPDAPYKEKLVAELESLKRRWQREALEEVRNRIDVKSSNAEIRGMLLKMMEE